MRFQETKIAGVVVVEPDLLQDERGFFTRIFCREEFRAQGLEDHLEQSSLSFNHKRGTVRGLHWQAAPHGETKVVACVEGHIYDVAVDVRPNSPSFCQWVSVELSAANRRMLYLPKGIAHGFQTLEDASMVLYQISSAFHPEATRGVRWNDPKLAITWPLGNDLTISDRDLHWPDWRSSGVRE